MIVPDEVVIAELLKDAKKFKKKRELKTAETIRHRPNTNFLARHLNVVVKQNESRYRRPKSPRSTEKALSNDEESSSSSGKRKDPIVCITISSSSSDDERSETVMKKRKKVETNYNEASTSKCSSNSTPKRNKSNQEKSEKSSKSKSKSKKKHKHSSK